MPMNGEPDESRKHRAKKPGVRARLKERGSDIADLGRTAVHQPRDVPQKVGGMFGKSVRDMYRARGGGFYACGFVISFLLLEARTLADDLFSSSGVGDFISGQLFEWVLRFALDSLGNTIQALIWPVTVIAWSPPFGIAGLAVGYIVFRQYIKEPLGLWLFGEEDTSESGD